MQTLRTKLFRRLFAGIMLVGLALFVADAFTSKNYFNKVSNLAFEERTILLMDSLTSLSPDLFTTSPILIKENINFIRAKASMSYIVVVDLYGNIVEHTFHDGMPKELEQFIIQRSMEENTNACKREDGFYTYDSHEVNLSKTSAVTIDGIEYLDTFDTIPAFGSIAIHYGIEKDALAAPLFRSLIFERQLMGAILAVLALIAVAIYSIFLVSPIGKLTEFAQRIARHDFTTKLDIKRTDEIGILASAMQKTSKEIASLIDSLEAKATEATSETQQTLKQMDVIINSLNEGVLLLNAEKLIVGSNSTAKSLFFLNNNELGISLRDLLQKALNNNHASYHAWEPLLEAVDAGLDYKGEIILPAETGLNTYMDFIVSNHTISEKHFILCVLRDVTLRRRAEEDLRSSHLRLENAVQERTSELMRVNAQLRRENTERRAIEQALTMAESRYRGIVDNAIEGIFQRTKDGQFLSANPAMAKILGFNSVEELLEHYATPGQPLCYTAEMENAFVELLEVRGWVSNLEFQAKMSSGAPVWVSMNARKVADANGETLYYEAFLEDITSRKQTEAKLMHQAFHDPLTGLPNRSLFLDRLRMAMRKSKRNPHYKFAVLYLDLDRFKNINDSFGHGAGDEMLKISTEKLRMHVREADTVARFGGDEFAILLDDLDKISTAVVVARRIAQSMCEPMIFYEQEVRIGASIGIVTTVADYSTPEDILRDADTAMYKAKNHERKSFMVFNKRMREETIASIVMENDLNHAVEKEEILAFYQPLIELDTGKVYGFESLMRWLRNGSTMVSPVEFIPIAEETSLINQLGNCILELVCKQLKNWSIQTDLKDISVHVNISGRQLMNPHFIREVNSILERTGVNSEQLIFEITESVFLDYGTQIIKNIATVRDLGIRFCLDDFGTGFSSLSYLRLLPLESIKVDRSFIIDVETNHHASAILRNLITMGNDLGLKVITEGVETKSQIEALQAIGCRYVQGYYFAKPLEPHNALEYLKTAGPVGTPHNKTLITS